MVVLPVPPFPANAIVFVINTNSSKNTYPEGRAFL
jgi:hypothetical protein